MKRIQDKAHCFNQIVELQQNETMQRVSFRMLKINAHVCLSINRDDYEYGLMLKRMYGERFFLFQSFDLRYE